MADAPIKYGIGVDFENENTSHSRMLRLVGGNKRVLEFGCSSGYMSRALQQQGCVVTGVEIDVKSAELAKSYCTRVIVADIENGDWANQLGDAVFDVAVFGDVLEHLKEPPVPLVLVRKFLARDGYVVASIPNIAHGSVRLALLQGQFQYRPLGLLDDTHLRFFTRQSIEDLFEVAGYTLQAVERSTAGIFETEIQVSRDSVPSQVLCELNHDEDALTYQYICKAVPAGKPQPVQMVRRTAVAQPASSVNSHALLQRVREAEACVREAERRAAQLDQELALEKATLQSVFNSKGWRLLNVFRDARIRARMLLRGAAKVATGRRRKMIERAPYKRWIEEVEIPSLDWSSMQAAAQKFTYRPLVSIVMPVYNPRLEHLQRAVESVRAQIYDHWQLCICDDASSAPELRPYLEEISKTDTRICVRFAEKNSGISLSSNAALELAQGEFIGLLDHDDELTRHALFEVVSLLQAQPDLDMIYSDEDKLDFQGERCDPFFKPDWSPEYMLSCMYTCHFGVYRRSIVSSVGGFRQGFEGSQDYDLVLRISENTSKIAHLPKVLYHWRQTATSTAASAGAKDYSTERGRRALDEHLARTGVIGIVAPGQGPNRYRVRPAIQGEPLVSIIIPTKDNVVTLKRCIDSISENTDYQHYEIIVIDNNSVEPATETYLSGLKHRVLKIAEPFNFSRINNLAVGQAEGAFLLFLNNDTEVISREWLTAMLEYAQLPEIGAVGAKLYYPNNSIQHGGVVLGIGGVAGHSHKYFPRASQGYFDSLTCIRNYSAVTAACMLLRREVFEDVGGFDEQLAVAFNDVDLCLRIREHGYRIVWTPYAELYHHESLSRGFSMNPKEITLVHQRWGQFLQNDPYYNPNLTLKSEDYTLRF